MYTFSAESACFGYSYSTCTAEKAHLSKSSVLDKRPAWILRFILSCVPYSLVIRSRFSLLFFFHRPGICRPLRYIKPCNVFFQCFNRFLDLAFSFSNPMDKHDPFFLVDLVESFPSLRLMSFQSRSLQKSSAFFFCFATDWGNKNSFWHRARCLSGREFSANGVSINVRKLSSKTQAVCDYAIGSTLVRKNMEAIPLQMHESLP